MKGQKSARHGNNVRLPYIYTGNSPFYVKSKPSSREDALNVKFCEDENNEENCKQHIIEIQTLRNSIKDAFERMQITQNNFDVLLQDADESLAELHQHQYNVAANYVNYFNDCATHIQRRYRGLLARRLACQKKLAYSALIIQRAYKKTKSRRYKQLIQFRAITKKVLHGLRVTHRKRLQLSALLQADSVSKIAKANGNHEVLYDLNEIGLLSSGSLKTKLINIFQRVYIMNSISRYLYKIAVINKRSDLVCELEGKLDGSVPPENVGKINQVSIEENKDQGLSEYLSEPKDSLKIATRNSLHNTAWSMTNQFCIYANSKDSINQANRYELLQKQKLYAQRVNEGNLLREISRIKKLQQGSFSTELQFKGSSELEQIVTGNNPIILRRLLEQHRHEIHKELKQWKEDESRREEATMNKIKEAKHRIITTALSAKTKEMLERKM